MWQYPLYLKPWVTLRQTGPPELPGRVLHASRSVPIAGQHSGPDRGQSRRLIQQLERGFPFKTLQAFESRSGLALSRLAAIDRNSGANPWPGARFPED